MKTLTLCAVSSALLVLAACDSRQETAGQKVDRTIAATENATKDLKQQGKEASAEMAQKVSDATITAAVNADLAKDSELSALRINVDTHDGRVALYGSAPSEEAKMRAERLAMAEKGVVGVDNKLAVEKR
ncbi:BON domain-containing protein [Piscinibacter sp.]|jgi:osmotically-inducible protein OsmY|uniref:BON domain-containing protein n=1 Tax=Piscinibacter sp. TaxID=1903157 RepID=UPI002F41B344